MPIIYKLSQNKLFTDYISMTSHMLRPRPQLLTNSAHSPPCFYEFLLKLMLFNIINAFNVTFNS